MADDSSATIIPLHQPTKKRPMTSAERGRAFRQRQREKLVGLGTQTERPAPSIHVTNVPNATDQWSAASALLTIAAFGLAAVGITMNGWFAKSLGSTDIAGWLFLGVGVAADLAAFALPASAARLWQARQRGSALVGWAIWAMTFAFAITAGIGFASINIADVTLARAQRSTPPVTSAQAALTDAMAARDRECANGIGKFCREREAAVSERRQALDLAVRTVEHMADPQTEAAIRIVAWVSAGAIRPSGDDFAVLRLILLAALPQIGGILFMIGRSQRRGASHCLKSAKQPPAS